MPEGAALVAVVIPSRDRGELLPAAIRSVLQQTYAPFQVVVVDDGSEPPLELPEELAADQRVRLIRSANRLGAAAARNLAVASTTAPLLAFLDDDDTWRPQKLTRQVEVLDGCSLDTAAVESGYDLWKNGRRVLRYLPDAERDLYRTLLERPCLQPSTVLLRRDAFDELGGFSTNLERTEDWMLWVQLAENYRVATIAEVHVDRLANTTVPAAELLHWYQVIVELLRSRIDERPPAEQSRIMATHRFVIGALMIETGDVRGARRQLFAAWRAAPSRWRPLAYLARTVVNDRLWRRSRRAALGVRALAFQFSRRDSTLRRW